jgi:pyruvate formate lyase activating enzyme
LEEPDLLLFDLKGIDPALHKRGTGATNEVILQNLRHLSEIGKDIIIRLPIIPGFTDDDDNIRETAELIAGLKSVRRVDLIAYHSYGAAKFGQRGLDYPLKGAEPISDGRMKAIKSVLERKGLNVQIGG